MFASGCFCGKKTSSDPTIYQHLASYSCSNLMQLPVCAENISGAIAATSTSGSYSRLTVHGSMAVIFMEFNKLKAPIIYVTGPEKTGLIYTKYTYSYYGPYLLFCINYAISVNCFEFIRILYIYGKICVEMPCCQVEILQLKD